MLIIFLIKNKTLVTPFVSAPRIRYTFSLCIKVRNNYCRMSDLTLGNVFGPAPKHMIRLSVEYRHYSKIPIRL